MQNNLQSRTEEVELISEKKNLAKEYGMMTDEISVMLR